MHSCMASKDAMGMDRILIGQSALQVNLNIESKAKHSRMAKKDAMGADYRRQKTGHAFSAANPYGKREAGDSRQFSRT